MNFFDYRRHRPYYHQDDEWYIWPLLFDLRVNDLEQRMDRNTDDIRRLRRNHENAREDARIFRKELKADQRAAFRRERDREEAEAEADRARIRADNRAARRRRDSDTEHEFRVVVYERDTAREDRNVERDFRHEAIAGAERLLRALRRDLDRDRL